MDTLRVIKDLLNDTSLETCKLGKQEKILEGTAVPSYFEASEISYKTNISYETIIGYIDSIQPRGDIFKATLGHKTLYYAVSEDSDELIESGLRKSFNLEDLEFNIYEEKDYKLGRLVLSIKKAGQLDTRRILAEVLVRYTNKSITNEYTENDEKYFNLYWSMLSTFISKEVAIKVYSIFKDYYKNKDKRELKDILILQEIR